MSACASLVVIINLHVQGSLLSPAAQVDGRGGPLTPLGAMRGQIGAETWPRDPPLALVEPIGTRDLAALAPPANRARRAPEHRRHVRTAQIGDAVVPHGVGLPKLRAQPAHGHE